jgi:hypothetical protein
MTAEETVNWQLEFEIGYKYCSAFSFNQSGQALTSSSVDTYGITAIFNTLRTGDANLRFNTRLVFTHLITQHMELFFLTGPPGRMFKKNVTLL